MVLERVMPTHKFKLGDLVQLKQTYAISAGRGPYEILRLLPEGDGVSLYRIKNSDENYERVAKETELRRFIA
jgi:hypothetical protein